MVLANYRVSKKIYLSTAGNDGGPMMIFLVFKCTDARFAKTIPLFSYFFAATPHGRMGVPKKNSESLVLVSQGKAGADRLVFFAA